MADPREAGQLPQTSLETLINSSILRFHAIEENQSGEPYSLLRAILEDLRNSGIDQKDLLSLIRQQTSFEPDLIEVVRLECEKKVGSDDPELELVIATHILGEEIKAHHPAIIQEESQRFRHFRPQEASTNSSSLDGLVSDTIQRFRQQRLDQSGFGPYTLRQAVSDLLLGPNVNPSEVLTATTQATSLPPEKVQEAQLEAKQEGKGDDRAALTVAAYLIIEEIKVRHPEIMQEESERVTRIPRPLSPQKR